MRRSKGHWQRGEQYLDQFMGAFALSSESLDRGTGFALHEGQQLVGFYLFADSDPAWLDYFFIDAPYIGKGFGKMLWDHAVETAKKLELIEFRIWSDTGAEEFYHRMGAYTSDKKLSLSTNILAPVLTYKL